MFFTLEKLERSTKKLKDLRYRERIEIPAFDASTPEEEPVGKRPESVVYTETLKKVISGPEEAPICGFVRS